MSADSPPPAVLDETQIRDRMLAEYAGYIAPLQPRFNPTHVLLLTGPWNKGHPDNTFACELSLQNVARVLQAVKLAKEYAAAIINCGEDVQIPWTGQLIMSCLPGIGMTDIDSGKRNVSNSLTQFIELAKWAAFNEASSMRIFIVSSSYHGMRVVRYAAKYLTPLGVQWQFTPDIHDARTFDPGLVESEIGKVISYAANGQIELFPEGT